MYVVESANVSFDEACHLLEQEAGRIFGAANRCLADSAPRLEQMEAGPLVRISAVVASLPLRWSGSTDGVPLERAELRILRVESGTDPVTELLGVASSRHAGTTLRGFLAEVTAQLERDARGPDRATSPISVVEVDIA